MEERGQGRKNMTVLHKGDLKIERDIPTAAELPIKILPLSI